MVEARKGREVGLVVERLIMDDPHETSEREVAEMRVWWDRIISGEEGVLVLPANKRDGPLFPAAEEELDGLAGAMKNGFRPLPVVKPDGALFQAIDAAVEEFEGLEPTGFQRGGG